MMRIHEIIWVQTFRDKIETEHGVNPEDVEYILQHPGLVRFVESGDVEGEDVYAAFGQTPGGRYLIVFFIDKGNAKALPISARSMAPKEKKLYARQKKGKS